MLHNFQTIVALIDFVFAIAGAFTLYNQIRANYRVDFQSIVLGLFVFAFFSSTFLLLWK